jgi:hypothetical protein
MIRIFKNNLLQDGRKSCHDQSLLTTDLVGLDKIHRLDMIYPTPI